MIEMTLHSVTVRCEDLTQALALLDSWARMGRIELPPEPRGRDEKLEAAAKRWADQVSPAFLKTVAENVSGAAEAFPRTPAPSAPPKAKPRAAEREPRPCAVCGDPFTSPSPRTVTCERHRMKPGQKLADIQKRYAREQAKNPAPRPPKRAPDLPAAKGLLGRPPIKPNESTKACSACGDKARVSDLDKVGRCRDCHPVGDPS